MLSITVLTVFQQTQCWGCKTLRLHDCYEIQNLSGRPTAPVRSSVHCFGELFRLRHEAVIVRTGQVRTDVRSAGALTSNKHGGVARNILYSPLKIVITIVKHSLAFYTRQSINYPEAGRHFPQSFQHEFPENRSWQFFTPPSINQPSISLNAVDMLQLNSLRIGQLLETMLMGKNSNK